jgi:hypothetical protein
VVVACVALMLLKLLEHLLTVTAGLIALISGGIALLL